MLALGSRACGWLAPTLCGRPAPPPPFSFPNVPSEPLLLWSPIADDFHELRSRSEEVHLSPFFSGCLFNPLRVTIRPRREPGELNSFFIDVETSG